MKILSKTSIILFYIITFNTVDAQPILAFPGAEGFGRYTQGGRAGKLIFVTNLNDSGLGSFRFACEASGKRIVLFKVGGLITLKRDIDIDHPNITIAGQTAPGRGILITGAGIKLRASEIIIRGIAVRPGSDARQDTDALSIISTKDLVHNVILDHCSFSWANDENISLNAMDEKIRNVTIQNCIISEGLLDHSMGLLVNKSLNGGGVDSLSILRNLFVHNGTRNPMVGSGGGVEVINNVVFNWQYKASGYYSDSKANVIGNYFIAGEDTKGAHRAIEVVGKPCIYLEGNIGPTRLSFDLNEINLVNGDHNYISSVMVMPESGVEYITAYEAYEYVLKNSGTLREDEIDTRIVLNVRQRSGRLINNEAEVGGITSFQYSLPLADKDHDGLPDKFGLRNNFDFDSTLDGRLDSNNDGKTNIEEFINHFY